MTTRWSEIKRQRQAQGVVEDFGGGQAQDRSTAQLSRVGNGASGSPARSPIVLAIDPGTTESAYVVLWSTGVPDETFHGKIPNEDLRRLLEINRNGWAQAVVIERIEPRYGSQMGMETIATAEWVGRFIEASRPLPVHLLRRSVILRHLGVMARGASADAGVRAALIDHFGGKDAAIGRKAAPGPLYGIVADQWQALAVALTFRDEPELAVTVPA
jgi:hypothetical protein